VAVRERILPGRTRARNAYTRILVPLAPGGRGRSELAVAVACRLAAERHAEVTALAVVEVPAELPLAAHMGEAEAGAAQVLAAAEAEGALFGVTIVPRLVRARAAGEAIVDEATARDAEVIVIGAQRNERSRRHAPRFGDTVAFVLRHAPCRVVVATPGGAG
jgi:basic amino acid/polyamine antiporter, APA family